MEKKKRWCCTQTQKTQVTSQLCHVRFRATISSCDKEEWPPGLSLKFEMNWVYVPWAALGGYAKSALSVEA